MVGPIAPAPATELLVSLDDFYAHEILRMFVTELSLHTQSQGGAVSHGQCAVIHFVGKDCLLMKCIVEIDAFIIGLGRAETAARQKVRAVKNYISSPRLQFYLIEKRAQPRSGPFANTTPSFNAVVAGYLRSCRKLPDVGQ